MLRETGGTGFPYLVFMNARGDVLVKQTERTIEGFRKSQHALTVLTTLDKPSLLRDKSVAAAVYIAHLELGKFQLTEATAKAAHLELDEKQKTIYTREITNLEVADLYAKARATRDYSILGAKFVEMKNDGRVPTGTWRRNFWSQIMNRAQVTRDAKLYGEAYASYKAILGADKRYQQLFDRYDAVLDALKNGTKIPSPERRPAMRIERAAFIRKE